MATQPLAIAAESRGSSIGTLRVQDEWSKTFWHRALRATGIRPRKFYATRHTYISLALTYGANPKHVAEYCGTSVMMIERHYGRYMGASDVDPLTAARAAASPPPEMQTRAVKGAKRQTFEQEARFPFEIKASPTVPSWNQIRDWLREMDVLRQGQAA